MSKCWYCNEELTTANYCDEHIGICTKCYGSMFQASNEFVKGLMNKIANLEAKLAESEHRNEQLVDALNGEVFINYKLPIENAQLKQQLAESEEDANKWKSISERLACVLDRFHYLGETPLYNTTREEYKISFAVDILEELADCSNYINSKLDFECGSYVSEKAIRDKIKYLKGKKDE